MSDIDDENDDDEQCPGDRCEHIIDDHEFYDCTGCDIEDAWALCIECEGGRWCLSCTCGGEPAIPVGMTEVQYKMVQTTHLEPKDKCKVSTQKNGLSSSQQSYDYLRCRAGARHKLSTPMSNMGVGNHSSAHMRRQNECN